jgi:MFS family permease
MMNALYFMVASTFTPYLAAYYRALDFSMLEVGVLAAVGSVSSILIQPFWSHLSDRLGNRLKVLRIVLLGSTASILLFMLPRSLSGCFWWLWCFRRFSPL